MKTTQEYENFVGTWLLKNSPLITKETIEGEVKILKAWDEHQSAQPTQSQSEKEELVEFNLEEALNEPERVRFRNGETPLEWHYFKTCKSGFPIATTGSDGLCISAKKDGKCSNYGINSHDLMLVKKKKVVWFGLYEDKHGVMYTTDVQNTKEEVEEYIDGRKLLKLYSYEE